MKFLAAVIFAVGAFAGDDKVKELTDEYTDAFVQAVSEGNADGMDKFWDNNTKLNFPSELPFGGQYTMDNMTLFASRFDKTMDTTSAEKKILAVDEAKGTALVLSTSKSEFKHNDKPVKMQIVHALKWNTATDKLISHDMIDKDVEETLDKYRTLAEKKLWAMIWATYKAGPEALKDGSSPVYDMISEDVQVKLNMHPDNIVSSTEFNGKDELIEGMKEWWDLGKKMPAHKNMEKQVKELKVLFADENEVFVEKKCTQGGKAIAHYTFDEGNDGLLIAEEVLLNEGLKPWDVYPFPMPMDEDDDDEEDDDEEDDDEEDEEDGEEKDFDEPEIMRRGQQDDEDGDNRKSRRGAQGMKGGRRSSGRFEDDDDDKDDQKFGRGEQDDEDGDNRKSRRGAQGMKGGRRSSGRFEDDDDDKDDQKFVLQDDDDDDNLKSRRSGRKPTRRGGDDEERESRPRRSATRRGAQQRRGRN